MRTTCLQKKRPKITSFLGRWPAKADTRGLFGFNIASRKFFTSLKSGLMVIFDRLVTSIYFSERYLHTQKTIAVHNDLDIIEIINLKWPVHRLNLKLPKLNYCRPPTKLAFSGFCVPQTHITRNIIQGESHRTEKYDYHKRKKKKKL